MALFVRRRWWPKAVAAVVMLGVVGALTYWHYAREPHYEGRPRIVETGQPLPSDTGPSPLPIARVYAAPASYPEQPVSGTVTVFEVVSPSAVWAGDSESAKVLVVIVSTERSFADVTAGMRLAVDGTVRPAAAEFAKAVVTDRAQQALLLRQAAYVEVTDYTTA